MLNIFKSKTKKMLIEEDIVKNEEQYEEEDITLLDNGIEYIKTDSEIAVQNYTSNLTH